MCLVLGLLKDTLSLTLKADFDEFFVWQSFASIINKCSLCDGSLIHSKMSGKLLNLSFIIYF